MTDESKNKQDTDELVLDWDDAVDSWGQDLDAAAKAESAPFPSHIEIPADLHDASSLRPGVFDRPTMPPGGLETDRSPPPTPPILGKLAGAEPSSVAEARPRMYRPPTAAEIASFQDSKAFNDSRSRTPIPPADDYLSRWSEDDSDATQIASIPRELIESLSRADASERELRVRNISVRPSDDESVSIALDDFDAEGSSAPHDTDPSGLEYGRDESGVFVPPVGRSAPSPATKPSQRPSFEPDPYPELEIGEEEDDQDATRIVDLNAEELVQPNSLALRSVPPPAPPPAPAKSLAASARHSDRPQVPPPPTREEMSVLRDLDDLAPPLESKRPSVPPAPGPVAAGEDRGAVAALRMVRSRKPRVEHLPLAEADDGGRRARLVLLRALAAKSSEHTACTLLVSAAELAEELADTDQARELYVEAAQKAPRAPEPIRALARLALEARDLDGYARYLEQEAAMPLERRVRARALSSLALVRWLVDRDLPTALRIATEANSLAPEDLEHALLLARIETSAHPKELDKTLTALADRTDDGALSAAWLVSAARALERRGERAQALALYTKATERDPFALDARLSAARTEHALGEHARAARSLMQTLESFDIGPVAEAVRRRAARLLGSTPEGRSEAVHWLDEAIDTASLRTASQLAMMGDDAELKERVVRAWSSTTQGTERALALVTFAEIRAESGETAEAEEALEGATIADPSMQLVAVVREVLARRRGDAAVLAEVVAGEEGGQGPLAAAAKLSVDPSAAEREVQWLLRARTAQVDPACTEALLLDVCAELGDLERVRTTLRAEADRAEGHTRISTLLTLADVERRHGGQETAQQALAEAVEVDTRDTVALRAFVRSRPPSNEMARAFRKEAEATTGVRAAFLQLRVGESLADDHDGRLLAFASAYEAAPGYMPSVWALHHEARRQGDLTRLSDLHSREAGRAKDPLEAVAHLVRAALVRAGNDTDAAAAQLARALDLMPGDPVLRELVIRLGDAVPATLRAEAIQRIADHAPGPLERPSTLAAAGAFEDANQPARAARLYSAVLRKHPGDPIADMGLERVASAAGMADELLSSKQRALADAATDAARVKALEDLLDLDVAATAEDTLARASEILRIDPAHPSALRKLERYAMESNDVDALITAELELAASSRGPRDRISRLRTLNVLAALKGPDKAVTERIDQLVLEAGLESEQGGWLARQLLSSGVALDRRDAMVRAVDMLMVQTSEPAELASLGIQRARLLLESAPSGLGAVLAEAVGKYPEHALAAETLAEARAAANDARAAAEHFEQAAKGSLYRTRIARMWYRAGKLWQDQLRSPDRARDAFRNAAEADIAYGDVQTRLEGLLSGRNDLAGLISLTEARVSAGGSAEQLGDLKRQLAKLYEKRGDKGLALTTLREALQATPDNLAMLRDLARAYEREGDHRECAEILIRLARLSRDPVELRDVFFKLGEIYDLHLPDARRAEAAYRRVLKLGPRHNKALERLAALYKREGQHELAVEALERLIQAAESNARKREVAFELAKLKEDHGDPRGAEETLESLRKSSPTDLYVLRGLADFYRRQSAQSALAMHLNRATNDLRHAVEADFDDAGLWTALVEVLDEKSRRDAARACASAAFALGLADAGVVAHTDNEGNVPGVGGAAFSELLDDLVFPESMPAGIRILFRYGAEALNKAVPFDLRTLGGEKLDRKHPLRGVVQEMARWVGATEIEIFTTAQLPFAFVPLSDTPVQLLVGRTLLDALSRGEQMFLVARALKIARAQMSITCRIRPDEMGLLIQGLMRSQSPNFSPEGVDLAALDEMARRVGKHVSRRAREDLMPHLVELAGTPEFDASRVYSVASTSGNRAGLLATGSAPSALSALAKLAGLALDVRLTPAVVAQVEEARELLGFAISEGHFEARQRAGADRR